MNSIFNLHVDVIYSLSTVTFDITEIKGRANFSTVEKEVLENSILNISKTLALTFIYTFMVNVNHVD